MTSFLVHCPTGPIYACEEHKRQLINLYDIMGCHVGVEEVEQEHDCPNCKNEKEENEKEEEGRSQNND